MLGPGEACEAIVSGRLEARSDGSLVGTGPVRVALSGERLQALFTRAGLHGVVVWGSGRAADVRFSRELPADAHVEVTPNRVTLRWSSGWLSVSALPRTPALVLRGRGELPRLRLVRPRGAPPGFPSAPHLERLGDGWRLVGDWSQTVLRAPGGCAGPRGSVAFGSGGVAVVAAGADASEVAAAVASACSDPARAEGELEAYQEWLRNVLRVPDAVLQSLVLHGLHAAFSARKTLANGRFAGLAAGSNYTLPPRTYYRDSYWALQALLPLAPGLAREQLLCLARGVHRDGEAPSGVVVAAAAGERSWRALREADPELARDHPRDSEWWADHVDSPLYFVLLLCDVADWTADPSSFSWSVDGVSLGALVHAALERTHAACDAAGIPVKPPHDRDWADNVYRGGHVTYLAGLYHGALTRVAQLIAARDPERAALYRTRARALREGARRLLWSEALGHFVEFREPDGRAEAHLAIDTLTALRYDLADDAQAQKVLESVRATLETRNNARQPYGDWGVMNVFPPYASWVRRRAKSRFAYRYHNGADWPFWDGVYAEQRMRRDLPGWRYPLTRWWTYGLGRGWTTPVEYHSPPYPAGSPSNAWSAMPVGAMLLGGLGLTPGGGARRPPWGECELQRPLADGRRQRVLVTGDRAEVELDG